ncbi:hypothetical protein [Streptomyces sp. NPDC046985]
MDGRVQDRLFHRGFATIDRCDGVTDNDLERGVVGRGNGGDGIGESVML